MGVLEDYEKKGYFIAEINGLHCTRLKFFLVEIGIAFKFPDYYGKNMNALWDCIGDLSWLRENNYLLIIRNFKNFLEDEDERTRKDIIDFFEKVTEDWKNVPNFDGEDNFRERSDFKVIYEN